MMLARRARAGYSFGAGAPDARGEERMAELAAAPGVQGQERDLSWPKLKIAFACLVGLMLAGGGFAQGAVALVMGPLQQAFGWSRAEIGFGLTLMTWAGAGAMPLFGMAMDRVGARWVLTGAAALIAAVTFAFGLVQGALWQFYACFVALGVLNASALGYTKIVSGLFSRHRGKAFALFTAEATIVAALLPQLMKVFLEQGGWRTVFLWLAALKLALALPILLAWLRDPARPAQASPSPDLLEGMGVGAALRTRAFWLIAAANMGGGLVIYGLLPHLVGMMKSHGLGLDAAVGAMSLMAVFNALGQLSSGFVIDRVPNPKVAAAYLCLFLAGIGLISVASAATGPLPLYAGVALMGLGGGSQQVMRNYMFTRYFGLKAFASILGLFMAMQAVLTAPSPFLIGLIYDRTGRYDLAFAAFVAAAVVSILAFLALPPFRFAAAAPRR
jgi:MFS family permease